ncbi:MAG: MFS transporter [Dehalococcoidia bacterium]|nr:MFS transporter [Dehalococcoidia bacterium]
MPSDSERQRPTQPVMNGNVRNGASGNGVGTHHGAAVELAGPQAEDHAPIANVGMFYSLSLRNFRLLWASQFFGSAGMWIQMTTLSWIVYDLTGKGTLLGAMNGMRAIPLLLLAPLAGVLVDRMDRRKLMLMCQGVMLFLTMGMAVGLALDQIDVWHLFAFTFVAGFVQVVWMPVQQTVVFDLVPRHAIPNAVALASAAFNVTRVFGPSAAGFLIKALGPEGNFFVQSAAYVGVLITLIMITFPARRGVPTGRSAGSIRSNLLDGMRYAIHTPMTRSLMLMGFIPPLLLIPTFMGLMPIFAKDVFRGGPDTLGFLLSATGVGGLIGALFVAALGKFERRGLIQLGSLLAASLSLLGFSFATSVAAALPFLVLAGFTEMVYMATTQTILQLSVPDHMRGRIISLFMLTMGLMPLASMVVGTLSDLFSAPVVVTAVSSIAAGLTVAIFLLSPRIRNLRLSQVVAAPSDSPAQPTAPATARR